MVRRLLLLILCCSGIYWLVQREAPSTFHQEDIAEETLTQKKLRKESSTHTSLPETESLLDPEESELEFDSFLRQFTATPSIKNESTSSSIVDPSDRPLFKKEEEIIAQSEALVDPAEAEAFLEQFLKEGQVIPKLKPGEELVNLSDQISKAKARLVLAQTLMQNEEEYPEALYHLNILLEEDAKNVEARLERTVLYVRLKCFKKANQDFQVLIDLGSPDPTLLARIAIVAADLGYMKISQYLFEKALRIDEGKTPQLLLDYAGTMLGWGDFYRSERIYRNALRQSPNSIDLKFKLAYALVTAQRYEEAEEIYIDLIETGESYSKALYERANVKVLQKDYPKALELARQLPLDYLNHEDYRFLKAQILFHENFYNEAEKEYWVLARSKKKSNRIKALIQLGRIAIKKRADQKAELLFQAVMQEEPGNLEASFYLALLYQDDCETLSQMIDSLQTSQDLTLWANLYIEEAEAAPAIALYRKAIDRNREYFPARLALAQVLPVYFHYQESMCIYEGLLEEFPENPKLMIEHARVVSWAKCYCRALRLYNEIIALNPCNVLPVREKARVALWSKRAELAMELYEEVLERLNCLDCFQEGYAKEKLYIATVLEKEAKCLVWNKRDFQALEFYEAWLEEEPSNQEALFDYAQLLQSIGLCEIAPQVYAQMLHLVPLNSIASIALERIEILLNPSLIANYTYWHEFGRAELSAISRQQFRVGEEYPIDCHSRLRFFINHWIERSYLINDVFPSNGWTVEAESRLSPYFSAMASLSQKVYENRHLRTQFLGQFQLWHRARDWFELGIGFERADEHPNYFAVIQQIQTNTVWGAFYTNLTRKWRVEAMYRYIDYNDHNSQNFAFLRTSYQLTESPNVFKVILEGEYRNTAHLNQWIFDPQGRLVTIIHPYWTPQHYYAGRVILEYRHDYAPFEFYEAEKRYFDIKVMKGYDTENNPAHALTIQWHHEFKKRWSLDIQMLIHRSPQWDAEGVWATLQHYF